MRAHPRFVTQRVWLLLPGSNQIPGDLGDVSGRIHKIGSAKGALLLMPTMLFVATNQAASPTLAINVQWNSCESGVMPIGMRRSGS